MYTKFNFPLTKSISSQSIKGFLIVPQSFFTNIDKHGWWHMRTLDNISFNSSAITPLAHRLCTLVHTSFLLRPVIIFSTTNCWSVSTLNLTMGKLNAHRVHGVCRKKHLETLQRFVSIYAKYAQLLMASTVNKRYKEQK